MICFFYSIKTVFPVVKRSELKTWSVYLLFIYGCTVTTYLFFWGVTNTCNFYFWFEKFFKVMMEFVIQYYIDLCFYSIHFQYTPSSNFLWTFFFLKMQGNGHLFPSFTLFWMRSYQSWKYPQVICCKTL